MQSSTSPTSPLLVPVLLPTLPCEVTGFVAIVALAAVLELKLPLAILLFSLVSTKLYLQLLPFESLILHSKSRYFNLS